MPRYMSFALTLDAIKDQTKTITRRIGWDHLAAGDLFWACPKTMGIPKGTVLERVALLRCKSNTKVRLDDYSILTKEEVEREGFRLMQPWGFVLMFSAENDVDADTIVNRIEFEYVPKAEWDAVLAEWEAAQKKKHVEQRAEYLAENAEKIRKRKAAQRQKLAAKRARLPKKPRKKARRRCPNCNHLF